MFFKKKEEKKECCKEISDERSTNFESKKKGILVLGTGCRKCNDLEINTKKALFRLGITEDIIHVTDFQNICSYGVMSTPALVIDNEVVSYGKVLSEVEILEILKKYRG